MDLSILSGYSKEFQKFIKGYFEKYKDDLNDLGLGEHLFPYYFSKKFHTKGEHKSNKTIDVNSNVSSEAITTYFSEFGKAQMWLNSLYLIYKDLKQNKGDEFIKKTFDYIFKGIIYIHDKHHFSSTFYCYAYDCLDWVIDGIPKSLNGNLPSRPAKHWDSFIQQTQNLLIHFSNAQSGAVAFPTFFVILHYFLEKDKKAGYWLDDERGIKQLKQRLQQFIYEMNQNTRSATQSPFTNLSYMCRGFMRSLFDNYKMPDGSELTEQDYNKILDLQDLFMEVLENEFEKNPFTFPVMTAAIARENNEILDKEAYHRALKHDLKRGVFNWFITEPTSFSSCCRLVNDYKGLKINSLGSGGLKIGSLGVVSIILPNMALYGESIKDVLMVSTELLRIKKDILKQRIKDGKLPVYNLGWVRLETQFQTIGVIGLPEFIELEYNQNILNEMGISGAKYLLQEISDFLDERNKDVESNYNLELVPAENAGVKTAQLTKRKGLHNYEIFSNQVIPMWQECDLLERIKIYAELESYFTGGNILHINQGEHIDDYNTLKQLIDYVISTGATYFVRNEVTGICENGHINIGINTNEEEPKCKKCNGRIVDFRTRVVGFQTSVSDWSEVKQQYDFKRRQHYTGVMKDEN